MNSKNLLISIAKNFVGMSREDLGCPDAVQTATEMSQLEKKILLILLHNNVLEWQDNRLQFSIMYSIRTHVKTH